MGAESGGRLSERAWLLIACLGGCLLLRAAAGGSGILVGLLLAHLDRQAPVPVWAVGLAAALFYGSELLGAPVFGLLSDRHGRRPYLLVSPLFGATSAAIMLALPVLPLLLFARLFQGLSTAASAPASLGFLADATSGNASLRGRVMAFFEVATVVGLVAGLAAGGVLWDHFKLLAFIPILLLYALSLVVFLRVRDVGERRPDGHGSPLAVLHLPGVTAFIPAWLAVNAILGAWFAHLPFQLARTDDPDQLLVGGFSGSQLGQYALVVGVLFAVGLIFWGQLLGLLGALRSMRFGLVGMAALVPTVYALNHTAPHDSTRVAITMALAAGALVVASGFTPAALAHLADISESGPGARGAVMGLYSVLLGLGQGLGAALASPLVQWFGVDGLILWTLLLTGVSALGVGVLSYHSFRAPRVIPPPAVRVEAES